VYFAARHRRRQVFVGLPTAIAIEGNKLAPWIGDLYLAHTGFKSQQYDGSEDPDRPDNLFAPVDDERDYGMHGAFDARAHRRSPQFWMAQHRAAVIGLGLVTAAGAVLAGQAWARWR
jgi:hypothetical protein